MRFVRENTRRGIKRNVKSFVLKTCKVDAFPTAAPGWTTRHSLSRTRNREWICWRGEVKFEKKAGSEHATPTWKLSPGTNTSGFFHGSGERKSRIGLGR